LEDFMTRKSLSRSTAEALGPIVVPLVTKVALPLAIESMRRGGKFDSNRFFEEAKASLAKGVKKSRSDREELKEQITERGSEIYDEVRKQGAEFLENLAERDRILFQHTVGLAHQTTADQLRRVTAGIRRLLDAHPKVDSTSARTTFIKFSGSSLDLEIFAYVLEREHTAFLAVQEDLLLGIMDIIDASGTSVAVPVFTTPQMKGPAVNT